MLSGQFGCVVSMNAQEFFSYVFSSRAVLRDVHKMSWEIWSCVLCVLKCGLGHPFCSFKRCRKHGSMWHVNALLMGASSVMKQYPRWPSENCVKAAAMATTSALSSALLWAFCRLETVQSMPLTQDSRVQIRFFTLQLSLV